MNTTTMHSNEARLNERQRGGTTAKPDLDDMLALLRATLVGLDLERCPLESRRSAGQA